MLNVSFIRICRLINEAIAKNRGSLSDMKILDIARNRSINGISPLGNLKGLEYLNLFSTKVKQYDADRVQESKLKRINLGYDICL